MGARRSGDSTEGSETMGAGLHRFLEVVVDQELLGLSRGADRAEPILRLLCCCYNVILNVVLLLNFNVSLLLFCAIVPVWEQELQQVKTAGMLQLRIEM